MPKEKDYMEIIEALKYPGYLDKFQCYFEKTERLKSIPDMIKKRIGLFDGKEWSYKNIGEDTYWVASQKRFRKKENEFLSPERIRQCLFKGYRIILLHRDEVNSCWHPHK